LFLPLRGPRVSRRISEERAAGTVYLESMTLQSDVFGALREELDRWRDAGCIAAFWWRDDDAIEPTPALARLLGLADSFSAEVAVAVIPAHASEALPEALARHSAAAVQHGYAHKNHARLGAKSVECGGDRSVEVVLEELTKGRAMMRRLFGSPADTILAVPWNRIERPVLDRLGETGLAAVSAYGPRNAMRGPHGLAVANAHVDPMNWRERRFAGDEKALSSVLGELRARRTGASDPDEPVGLLTHHLDHDEPFWAFVERLLRVTTDHEAARWITIDEAFGLLPTSRPVEAAT
jgi:hypothetical protein